MADEKAKVQKATRTQDHVGTSVFTHVDDEGADIHPSNPEHAEALFYGGRVPPKTEVEEIVLGPGAFGSPDPRTLGHIMNPVIDEAPDSAPELDKSFEKYMQANRVGRMSEDQIDDMTNDELYEYGQKVGADVNSSMNKSELTDTIKDHLTSQTEAESTEGDSETTEGAGADYKSMSKADLLDLASSRNIDVDQSNTKDEIVSELEEADQS